MQNHKFVSTFCSTHERLKAHDAEFHHEDWRERKTLHCGASKTTLIAKQYGLTVVLGMTTDLGSLLPCQENNIVTTQHQISTT